MNPDLFLTIRGGVLYAQPIQEKPRPSREGELIPDILQKRPEIPGAVLSMSLQIILIILAVIVALLLTVWRFSGGRYGNLRPSGEAAAAYEAFRVNPGLNYYLSGSDLYPNALMGVDNAWVLISDLWKKRDLSPEGMKELVQGMQAKAMESLATLSGFDVLDDRGRIIGNWLSLPGLCVTVRITGENRVEISTPPPDTYAMK
jgi:hypothetical protein